MTISGEGLFATISVSQPSGGKQEESKGKTLSEVDELIFDILIPARRFLHKSEMKR
jgi:hypothetical protein